MSNQDYLDHNSAKNPTIDQHGAAINSISGSSPAPTTQAQASSNYSSDSHHAQSASDQNAADNFAANLTAETASVTGMTGDKVDTLGTLGTHPPVHDTPGTAEERPKLPRHGFM